MSKSSKSTAERIANHPMYTPSDLAYFRTKGYSDVEILAFWDRDQARGCEPVHHRPAPNVVDAITGRQPPETFEVARPDGSKVRVTVPENDPAEPAKELRDLLQDCMSPHAVAAIVAYLQPVRTNNPDVDRQVHWFAEQLVELLGGNEQQNRLAEELGL